MISIGFDGWKAKAGAATRQTANIESALDARIIMIDTFDRTFPRL